ncbi:MAG TPA: FISUMP domain-containing protein [Bacteroidales bacterium]|nr:FISUMP domain-containing protein [Bacteroidales bacterium]HNS47104.1 FISUMP domain-containing protein [Bacteroidales bacterium]
MNRHLPGAILLMMAILILPGQNRAALSDAIPSAEFTEYSFLTPDVPSPPEESEVLCADVNEDGVVNVLDIIFMVNYIMGNDPHPFNEDVADVNADGWINVLDIISMVNIIMQVPGIPCSCVAPVLYEGQTYSTVQIGDQCWLRENLNVGTMINSTSAGYQQQDNGIIEKYCFGNNEENCAIYGGLYEWPEAMQYVSDEGAQGICPPGWHLPSDGEWSNLNVFLGGSAVAGGKMKSTGTIEAGTGLWHTPNAGATNESGFTGFPGGYRDAGGVDFGLLGTYGFFWSSTQSGTNSAWLRYLATDDATLYRVDNSFDNEWSGYSVRCIKGCWPEPTQSDAGPDQLDIQGTSVMLAGNTPEYGTGLWEVLNGTGGTINDPSSPSSQFQGAAGSEYTLSWTITTACGSSSDQVVISFISGGGFSCGDPLVDERDGQSYATVPIDFMCWMAENLNVGTMIASTSGGQLQTNNQMIEKYCYDDDPANCITYGGLYEWNEAMQYLTTPGAQGICPVGWHIPTEGEYDMLANELGGEAVAGGKMKSTGTIEDGTGLWYEPNVGATNSSGFTGLPHGYRDAGDGSTWSLGYYGDYWTSSQYDADNAWYRALENDWADLDHSDYDKNGGSAIRCIKSCSPSPTPANAGPDQHGLPGTSTSLAGNTPVEGTGMWQIISGDGGTLADPTNPTSGFQGQPCTIYTLSWSITTVCGTSSDLVAISFAQEGTFTCGDLLEDCRDGQFYATVQIGDQCWMAQNLNTGTMIYSNDGGQLQTDNQVIEKFCYDNNPANCDTYGGLYEWYEAMQYQTAEGVQGVCSYGWHFPTDGEFTELTDYLGGEAVAGGAMKATGTIEQGTGLWHEPNTAATNFSGFTALPSGYQDHWDGIFVDLGYYGEYWTSTQYDSDYAYYRGLFNDGAEVYRSDWYKEGGSGIRCIRDCTPQPTQANAGPDQILMGVTSTALQGNIPIFGLGEWEIVEGYGGIISNPANPFSTFQGQADVFYVLSWTITTICGSSTDRVSIYFSSCTNEINEYTYEDLTDPYAYEYDSWTDIGWADISVPTNENIVVSCILVTAAQICSDEWPDEVYLFLKSPAGTTVQIWQGFADNGCTNDFTFTTDAFDGETSGGQWLLYFEDLYGDGGGTCVGAKLYVGH